MLCPGTPCAPESSQVASNTSPGPNQRASSYGTRRSDDARDRLATRSGGSRPVRDLGVANMRGPILDHPCSATSCAQRRQGRSNDSAQVQPGCQSGAGHLRPGAVVTPAACSDLAPNGATVAATGKLLYDAAADKYLYTWQTDKTWTNSCRKLSFTLVDATIHEALFNFTK
jgi:hypothetical protein